MAADYLLGIDSGTSVVKAALFDFEGREVAAASQRTILKNPHPDWSETSMIGTWDACVNTIRELLQKSNIDGSRIAAVGVTGNMIGAWLIDAQGQPVRDAILWNDGRTGPLIERLSAEQPGFLSRIFDFDGCVLEKGCTLPVLRWLADNEPAALERAQVVFGSKDWLCFKMTGTIHLDPTEAAGLPGNTRTQSYDDRLLEMFGLGRFKRLLPPIVPSESIVGGVLPEVAEITGLLAGTPVAAGAGDVPSNALGVGGVEPGIAFTVLGTNLQACLATDEPIFEPRDVGLLFYVPGRRWFKALMNVAGTTNLDWFIDQFYSTERDAAPSRADLFAELEKIVQQSEVGARGIIYHPYLSSVGVIAPFVEPAARAQFFGLTQQHRRADMLRAVYEGVALAIRDLYSVLNRPITEIRFAGGGAHSPFWSQVIADCMGARVAIPTGSEFGAKGAALLAGVGIGVFNNIVEASTTTLHVARTYDPDLTLTPRYTAIYEVYRMLRDVVRPAWERNASIH